MIPNLLLTLIFTFSLHLQPVRAYTSTLLVAKQDIQPCVSTTLVYIKIDDAQYQVITDKCTNEEVILDYYDTSEVEVVAPTDRVWPKKLIVARVVKRDRTLTFESIPFNIERTYTKALPHRKEQIVQKGVAGIEGEIIETVTYKDGSQRKVLVESWVEKEPVTHKVNIGTQYDLQKTVIGEHEVYYWKTLTVLATSYDRNCYGCNDITATGAKLRKGIIAVDPRVIPLHTKMYVPGYGFGQAEDTGGAVKGNKIDLGFYDLSEGYWSRRWVTIYIID